MSERFQYLITGRRGFFAQLPTEVVTYFSFLDLQLTNVPDVTQRIEKPGSNI